MDLSQAKTRIQELCRQIEGYDHQYYALNQPTVADLEYDKLLKELIALEEKFPQFKSPVSPTQRVGVKVAGDVPTIKHQVKMLSLDNTYNVDDLRAWYSRVLKGLDGQQPSLVAELKIDGLSCALTYDKGNLTLAATRGDGAIGENVTHNAKTIRSIPLQLQGDVPALLELRGEVYMDKADFTLLNQQRKSEGEELFANPRNAAAGSLKLLDSRLTAQRHLEFFVHSFGVLKGKQLFNSQWDFLQQVKAWGLPVSTHSRLCKNLDEVIAYCNEYQQQRESIPYDVDGVVIKVNDLAQQVILGETMKSPRWAVAFKFPAYQATTTVKAIVVQVGRTGVITPVAELEPVACSGVMIARATLHNFDEIKRLNVNVGDRVLLERAGDVIPKIVKVVAKLSKSYFHLPHNCPSCGGEITKGKQEDVAYRCLNMACPQQLQRALVHFASRDAMDIEGLGESVVEQLLQKGLIHDLADIYALTKEDLMGLDLFKDKKADNLLKAIVLSKEKPLSKFIYGLGIDNIGIKAATNLARHFSSLDDMIKVSEADVEAIDEFGPVMAQSVIRFFHLPATARLLVKIKAAGLSLKEPRTALQGDRLKGSKFVFTGELDGLTRNEAGQMVEGLGGQVIDSVSKAATYVVVGANPGSKVQKAQQLGIKILNQKEFEEIIHA